MTAATVRLGLRANRAQFSLLVLVNAFVGAMIGMERSILPAIAVEDFHLAERVGILSFIAVFGLTKAASNYLAGRLGDRYGRKHILVAGWLVAVPVPFMLMWAPDWNWVLAANALLGISQGLTWSMTVIMKIDLVGPRQRGLAMGLNEFAGYVAVAASALATGWIAARYGLRPEPFYPGVGFVVIGLVLSVTLVRETSHHVAHELKTGGHGVDLPTQREVFLRTSFTDRNLSAISQAGLVNNLNDGMAWGIFPLFYAAASMTLDRNRPSCRRLPRHLGRGPALHRRAVRPHRPEMVDRRRACGCRRLESHAVILSAGFAGFATGAVLLGLGTAMVYPTLLAAIGDVAHPAWRGSAVGIYRLWRDLGYAVGASRSRHRRRRPRPRRCNVDRRWRHVRFRHRHCPTHAGTAFRRVGARRYRRIHRQPSLRWPCHQLIDRS